MQQVFGKLRIAFLVLAPALIGVSQARAELLGADELLKRIEKSPAGKTAEPPSKAAELLSDVKRFRATSRGMDPKKAAAAWLDLYDRAEKLGPVAFQGDYRVFDQDVSNVVGIQSVIGALPPPAAWPALQEGARARATKTPDSRSLSLQLLTDFLTGDRRASIATLAEIDRLTLKLAPKERELPSMQVAQIRTQAAALYGTPEEIAGSFIASLESLAKRSYGDVPVPDLVGLVGEARASAILRDALSKPVRLHVPEGDGTRAMARRMALERVAALPVPQWGLVDGVEGAELYEALAHRFSGGAPAAKGQEAQAISAQDPFSSRKAEADAYYFLSLVIKGRHSDAERALRTLAGERDLSIPKRAVEALQRAGFNEQLFRFLHSLLGRRPELRAWEVYTREGAYTGHSAEVLGLIDELLKRKDLPDFVVSDLRFYRVNALLAADKVEPAVVSLGELLAAPPKRDERTLQARADAAVRLAGLGRVLKRPDLSRRGLSFARAVLAFPPDRERSWERDRLLKDVFAEQRKAGLIDECQALALAQLQRSAETPNEYEQYGMGTASEVRAAMVELAALYGQAQRPRDVVVLLDQSSKWGVRDLNALLQEKDSLGVPLGLTAARALVETGNSAAALSLARAVVEALPGYDPAYELVARLDKGASEFMDGVYSRDRFEERPLIWKAIVLSRQGRLVEAESLVRQAIVIDPSDGEEGPNDRMRAYAVLADVLEAKGSKEPAAQFRKAVQAIRISERSDELHRLGLYERAFAGYREALEQFSDAYCIQSRLAVRLNEQGRRQEAFEHYRRAYELMPASFGRVESHCFGCESVFQGPEQQKIAEKVFVDLLAKDQSRPQVHYLLGYLRKEQGHYGEALKGFREAVRLDGEYLNAWKHLHDLGSHVYVDARERDAARLKLLELDPRQRHVRYQLDAVGELAALWNAVSAVRSVNAQAAGDKSLYPLRASAATVDEALAKLPEPIRLQVQQYQQMTIASQQEAGIASSPSQVLFQHKLIKATAQLMGVRSLGMD